MIRLQTFARVCSWPIRTGQVRGYCSTIVGMPVANVRRILESQANELRRYTKQGTSASPPDTRLYLEEWEGDKNFFEEEPIAERFCASLEVNRLETLRWELAHNGKDSALLQSTVDQIPRTGSEILERIKSMRPARQRLELCLYMGTLLAAISTIVHEDFNSTFRPPKKDPPKMPLDWDTISQKLDQENNYIYRFRLPDEEGPWFYQNPYEVCDAMSSNLYRFPEPSTYPYHVTMNESLKRLNLRWSWDAYEEFKRWRNVYTLPLEPREYETILPEFCKMNYVTNSLKQSFEGFISNLGHHKDIIQNQ